MRQPVIRSLEQKVGEDRNGGLAFDHTLRSSEFFEQFELADADIHRCALDCSRCFGSHIFHLGQASNSVTPLPEIAVCRDDLRKRTRNYC